MQDSELKDLICDLFLDGDREFPIDADTDLLESGICDSLGLAQLASEIESRRPGLRILDPDVTPDNLGSIERILAFLAAQPGG